MAKLLTGTDVFRHSKQVYKQFGESKWIPNAKHNAAAPHKDSGELWSCGVGKVLVLVGMGESLQAEIENLKKYRHLVDICVCDKGFGPLLDQGIKADYVFMCDANIPFSYLEKWKDQTHGVKLLATPYANPEWTDAWLGDRYYFVMRDAIESENVFYPIMGRIRDICAGSNVSNGMVTFFLGCDEWNNKNWAGYERYLLVGYDYSWRPDGNYYAWINPKPKRHYMNHRTMIDVYGNIIFTSENLYFSVRWLISYLTQFNGMPVWNCSGRGILEIKRRSKLIEQLARINPDPKASQRVRQSFEALKSANKTMQEAARMFNSAREDLIWQ